MDRIVQMKQSQCYSKHVFAELGIAQWSRLDDAFVVRTRRGATFLLSPNSDDNVFTRVHIDEIEVPEPLRRRGVATAAMATLCRLADKYQFTLEGGPIGWREDPWRDKFVEWMFRFGFEPDPSPVLPPVDDPGAFYVCRQPKPDATT